MFQLKQKNNTRSRIPAVSTNILWIELDRTNVLRTSLKTTESIRMFFYLTEDPDKTGIAEDCSIRNPRASIETLIQTWVIATPLYNGRILQTDGIFYFSPLIGFCIYPFLPPPPHCLCNTNWYRCVTGIRFVASSAASSAFAFPIISHLPRRVSTHQIFCWGDFAECLPRKMIVRHPVAVICVCKKEHPQSRSI